MKKIDLIRREVVDLSIMVKQLRDYEHIWLGHGNYIVSRCKKIRNIEDADEMFLELFKLLLKYPFLAKDYLKTSKMLNGIDYEYQFQSD